MLFIKVISRQLAFYCYEWEKTGFTIPFNVRWYWI
jgi:hypothetical protein